MAAPAAADWAGLPHDVLVLIAKRVKVIEDFIAFGGVCTSWRMASTKDNFDVLSPQLPLLMLSNDHTDDYYREFYSFSKGKVTRRLYLPETKRRGCVPFHQMGWILTQSSYGGEEVNLLNPFSSAKIKLPDQFPLMALQGPDDNLYDPGFFNSIDKACLSANPSFTSDYVLVVSYKRGDEYLAYWIPGDINWTEIHLANRFGAVCNMVYYKGLFYLVTRGAEIWIVDVQRPQRRIESRFIYLCDYEDLLQQQLTQYYLVEVNDALLFVVRFGRPRPNADDGEETFKCEVYEFDEMTAKLKKINNLGDSAIFLGFNGATSVDSTKFTGVKPNHIYFTYDWREENYFLERGAGKDTGVYNLEDGNIEFFDVGLSLSHNCPPTWVIPSL